MQKTTPEWCQWLHEQSDIEPRTAKLLRQMEYLKAIPPAVETMRNINHTLVRELCNLQKGWGDRDWFIYHYHANDSASLDPEAHLKARKRRVDYIDFRKHCRRVCTYMDAYFLKLNIPLNDSYGRELEKLFGAKGQADAAMAIIQNAVFTRLAAEEMLHLCGEEEVLELPGMQSFTERKLVFAAADDVW
ncbi:hypothetical protein COU75_01060 [Candidatus Peregrinibacteria bacterium CG10_big_fil_rev_8_21_14_0_10_42_8]|nr:MAG: hypothetical protein COU75_01060 [Candidatus Peregrinibacteria bacterium CG10_big_fil_rev_8_21_14_0_10_42_8]